MEATKDIGELVRGIGTPQTDRIGLMEIQVMKHAVADLGSDKALFLDFFNKYKEYLGTYVKGVGELQDYLEAYAGARIGCILASLCSSGEVLREVRDRIIGYLPKKAREAGYWQVEYEGHGW